MSDDAEETNVLADATAVLANKAMNHVMKLCGNRTGLMFAVSAMTTERLRVLYQHDVDRQVRDLEKQEGRDVEA